MEDSRGRKLSFMKMWLDHVGDESFNLAAEPRPAEFAAMNFPVFTATGFFDDDQPGALHCYRRFLRYASPKEASAILLVIGPWDHLGTQHPQKVIDGLSIPDAAVLDMNKLHADWYDWVLGRSPRPELLRDRVTYYMRARTGGAMRTPWTALHPARTSRSTSKIPPAHRKTSSIPARF